MPGEDDLSGKGTDNSELEGVRGSGRGRGRDMYVHELYSSPHDSCYRVTIHNRTLENLNLSQHAK